MDLALEGKEPLTPATIGELKEKLSNSDLLYKVDVIDYNAVSDSFNDLIDQHKTTLSHAQPVYQVSSVNQQ